MSIITTKKQFVNQLNTLESLEARLDRLYTIVNELDGMAHIATHQTINDLNRQITNHPLFDSCRLFSNLSREALISEFETNLISQNV